jgi:hypothetical protein
MVPCHVKQAVLRKLGFAVDSPGGFKPAKADIASSLAFLVEAIFYTSRPTAMKVASMCYPIRLPVENLVKPVRLLDKLRPVFKHAFPTPVRFCLLLVTALGIVSFGKALTLLYLTSEKTESTYLHTCSL